MANRYWRGGSGTWDATSTTNWSATSGGLGGASAPTSADNVFFDSLSNATAYTVTVGTNAVCADLTAAGPLVGIVTFSLGATAVINCYGSFTLAATGITWTGTNGCSLIFAATTTGKTITTNGVTLANTTITFDGIGGGWTLGSAIATSTNQILINNGAFNTANFNVTTGTINSGVGTGIRSLSFGSSTISCNTNISFVPRAEFTFNAGTSQINCTGVSPTFAGGGYTFYNVNFTSNAAGATTITGANTFNTLNQTSRSATGVRVVTIGANQTVNGTLTLGAANTSVRRIQVQSDVIGTRRTITLNGTLATLADCDFRDIATAGSVGTWTGTRIGNGLNNSGITFDAAKTVYWNFAAGGQWVSTAWATSSGGAVNLNNFPLAQDKAIIENTGLNSGASIGLSVAAFWIGELDISTRTLPMTFASSTIAGVVYKNITLSSAVTSTGTVAWVFSGQGTTQILDVNTATFVPPITIDSPSGTLQLAENTTCSATVTLTSGTLDLNNNVLTANVFSSSNSNTRVIAFGTGNITLTGSGTTIWTTSIATNLSVTGTPTVNCTYSGSTGTRIITPNQTTTNNLFSFNITAGSDTLSISSSRNLNSLNFTGFSGILSTFATTSLGIYGDLTFSPTMTFAAFGAGSFQLANSTNQKITSNGLIVQAPININNGSNTQLQDNLTIGSTFTFNLINGTLDLNNRTLSCGLFSASNTNTRSIAFGTGNITLTGNDATIWTTSIATNFTVTGTPNVNATYSGSTGTRTFISGATTGSYINLNISAGSDTVTSGGTSNFNNLNFTGFSGTLGNVNRNIYGNLTLSSGMTLTAGTGLLQFLATSGTQLVTTNGVAIDLPVTQNGVGGTVQLQDNLTIGSTRTFTLTSGSLTLNNNTLSCGLFSSTNTNTRSISFGTGNITLTGNAAIIWNTAAATGFTYTGTPTVNATYSGSTGTRTIGHGSTSGATETNSPNFNITAGSDTVTLSSTFYVKNLNFTGFTGTLTAANRFIYGNLTISSGMTLPAGANGTTFAATSGTQQITSNGQTIDFPFTQNGVGGTVQLQDNMTIGSTRTFTLTAGTLDLNGKVLTTGLFDSSNSNARSIAFGAGALTISGTVFNATTSTNLTIIGQATGTINLTSATAKTFAGGGAYYPTINQGGSGALTILGANTFYNITDSFQPATINFPASTTTSFYNFNLNGTSGNLITIDSTVSGTQATLNNIGLSVVSISFCNIQDTNVIGTFGWQAYYTNGNIDSGNNTGWLFVSPLATNNIIFAEFVRVSTPSATYRFASTPSALTIPAVDSQPFNALGQLIKVNDAQQDIKSTANETTFTLVGIDQTMLGWVLGQEIKGSKIEAWHGFFDANGALITQLGDGGLTKFFTGYINSFTITEQWMEEIRQFVGVITVSASSIQLILKNRLAGRYTNDNNWQFFDDGDTSMNRVAYVSTINYYFGKGAAPNS